MADENQDTKYQDAKKRHLVAEILTTIAWALAIAIVMRTFLFQPFHIPSGSMEPNLVKGDYIVTSKYSVGYGKYAADPFPFPRTSGRLFERSLKRGDVLLFKPVSSEVTFIKRLAGMPGDQMQIKKGVLHINGIPVDLTRKPNEDNAQSADIAEMWEETFQGRKPHNIYNRITHHELDDTGVYTVPAGYYFMLGDNRDRSADSRIPASEGGAGYIPAENIIGRAEFVLLSVKEDFSLKKPWTWNRMHGGRFFKGLR